MSLAIDLVDIASAFVEGSQFWSVMSDCNLTSTQKTRMRSSHIQMTKSLGKLQEESEVSKAITKIEFYWWILNRDAQWIWHLSAK